MNFDKRYRILNYIAMVGWTWLGYLYGLTSMWKMLLLISGLHLIFQLVLILLAKTEKVKK